jgi:hypothetical protein
MGLISEQKMAANCFKKRRRLYGITVEIMLSRDSMQGLFEFKPDLLLLS